MKKKSASRFPRLAVLVVAAVLPDVVLAALAQVTRLVISVSITIRDKLIIDPSALFHLHRMNGAWEEKNCSQKNTWISFFYTFLCFWGKIFIPKIS